MARKIHMRLPPIGPDRSTRLTPKALSKQEFGQRLYTLIKEKGWHQSEMSRQSGVPRDSISSYVRGRVYPTPVNLQKLADALGVEPIDLLPNHTASAMRNSEPAFEMIVAPETPRVAWLRINRLVSLATATKIAELMQADDAVDRDGSS